ncbi:MAG: GDSL-type esterase/lipase family protein [archaeon]
MPKTNSGDNVIILCGTNDIYQRENSSQIIKDIEKIYFSLKDKNTTPIFLTIPPHEPIGNCRTILEVNSWMKEFAVENNITLVEIHPILTNGSNCYINKDLFKDEVHLNEKGNSLISELIWKKAFDKEVYQNNNFFVKILGWFIKP